MSSILGEVKMCYTLTCWLILHFMNEVDVDVAASVVVANTTVQNRNHWSNSGKLVLKDTL